MRTSHFIYRIFALIGALTLFAVVILAVGTQFVGKWLRSADTAVHSDVIVVLAGHPDRAIYAADLFNQGFAPVVVLSRQERGQAHRVLEEFGIFLPSNEQINSTILTKKGVPEQAIRTFTSSAVNTVEEAIITRQNLTPGIERILVVTSLYNIRRARMIFNDVFAGTDISIAVVTNPYESLPENWWTDRNSARHVVLEFVKLIFYLSGGSFSKSNTK